jgi:hypothetical protein
MNEWHIRKSLEGKLSLYNGESLVADEVMPVLSFPFSAPEESISIIDIYGKELAWLNRLDELDKESCDLVKNYLTVREYRPTILQITSVSSYSTPSIWTLRTDKGLCNFELSTEENIRRLGDGRLVLTHANGMQFIVHDMFNLDSKSRQILARFMA